MGSTREQKRFLDIKLISRKEFAKHLDVEEDTLRRFFAKHKIPTRKICGEKMFLMEDLLKNVPAKVGIDKGEEIVSPAPGPNAKKKRRRRKNESDKSDD